MRSFPTDSIFRRVAIIWAAKRSQWPSFSAALLTSYGTKEALIIRLLAQRELRFKLARFTDNPDELASSYRRESLRDMCREAGIWRSGNKRAFSAGLLNWRDRCRARGQAFLAEMRSPAKDRPQQLTFRFQASKFRPNRNDFERVRFLTIVRIENRKNLALERLHGLSRGLERIDPARSLKDRTVVRYVTLTFLRVLLAFTGSE